MEKVVDVATVTKLTRNLFIIAVIPLVSYFFFKNEGKKENGMTTQLPKWYKLVPLFVFGFLFLSFSSNDWRCDGSQILGPPLVFSIHATWEGFYNSWSSFGSKYMLGLSNGWSWLIDKL